MDNWELLGREISPLPILCSCRQTNNEIDKKTVNRRKRINFNSGISFLKEMKPKKWLKQAAFILFDKKKKNNNTFNI